MAMAASITDSGRVAMASSDSAPVSLKLYTYPSAIDVSEIYYVDVDEDPEVRALRVLPDGLIFTAEHHHTTL